MYFSGFSIGSGDGYNMLYDTSSFFGDVGY